MPTIRGSLVPGWVMSTGEPSVTVVDGDGVVKTMPAKCLPQDTLRAELEELALAASSDFERYQVRLMHNRGVVTTREELRSGIWTICQRWYTTEFPDAVDRLYNIIDTRRKEPDPRG